MTWPNAHGPYAEFRNRKRNQRLRLTRQAESTAMPWIFKQCLGSKKQGDAIRSNNFGLHDPAKAGVRLRALCPLQPTVGFARFSHS